MNYHQDNNNSNHSVRSLAPKDLREEMEQGECLVSQGLLENEDHRDVLDPPGNLENRGSLGFQGR
jgi:hypothetical protein